MAYLPQLARQVLGEDLKLPSVETWWCGTAQGRQHVLANLETMVIKPIDRSGQALWGGALSQEAGKAFGVRLRRSRRPSWASPRLWKERRRPL